MNEIFNESCLNVMRRLAPKSVNTIVTSPPYYGLRDYGVEGQIGLEQTPQEYVEKLVSVFRACREVLRDDGSLWLNLGDSYAGSGKGPSGNFSKGKEADNARNMWQSERGGQVSGLIPEGLKAKDLIGIPWRVAFALQSDGWYLRQDIIWHKPNPMPESVKDRCTKAHEYIFLLSKRPKYYFDHKAIQEPTADGNTKPRNFRKTGAGTTLRNDTGNAYIPRSIRNKRDVWSVNVRPCKEAHFATFPPDLIRPCILAGAPKHGVVLDPFMGAGTTAMVCKQEHRQYVGFEMNPAYIEIAQRRIALVPDELEFEIEPARQ